MAEFSNTILAEVKSITPPSLANRPDVWGYPVDNPLLTFARDDVFSVNDDDENKLIINVSVADYDAVVPLGSLIDQNIHLRRASRIDDTGFHPMLPSELITKHLSLDTQALRPAFTISVTLDQSFDIDKVDLNLTRIRARKASTFAQASAVIAKDPSSYFFNWYGYARRIMRRRMLGDPVARLNLEPDLINYRINQWPHVPRSENEREGAFIVREFMNLANAAFALEMRRRGVPIIYFNHELTERGLAMKNNGTLGRLSSSAFFPEIFKRSEYSSECKGHAGLNFLAYAPITSPLRDVVCAINQRLGAWSVRSEQQSVASHPTEALPYTEHQIIHFAHEAQEYSERLRQEAKRPKTIVEILNLIAVRTADHISVLSRSEFRTLLEHIIDHEGGDEEVMKAVAERLRTKSGQKNLAFILMSANNAFQARSPEAEQIEPEEIPELAGEMPDIEAAPPDYSEIPDSLNDDTALPDHVDIFPADPPPDMPEAEEGVHFGWMKQSMTLYDLRRAALSRLEEKQSHFALGVMKAARELKWQIESDEFHLPGQEAGHLTRYRIKIGDRWLCSRTIAEPSRSILDSKIRGAILFFHDFVEGSMIESAPLNGTAVMATLDTLTLREQNIASLGAAGQLAVLAYRRGWTVADKLSHDGSEAKVKINLALAGARTEITAIAAGPDYATAHQNAVHRMFAQMKNDEAHGPLN